MHCIEDGYAHELEAACMDAYSPTHRLLAQHHCHCGALRKADSTNASSRIADA